MKSSKIIPDNYYVSVIFHPTQYDSNLFNHMFAAHHGLIIKENTTSHN